MNKKTKKTLSSLILKACGYKRMPNIKSIHNMLDDLGIKHWFFETQNICETKNGQRAYVNSRWGGKKGYEIKVFGIHLDTSDSYYSYDSGMYAKEIVRHLIKEGYISKELVLELAGKNCDIFK